MRKKIIIILSVLCVLLTLIIGFSILLHEDVKSKAKYIKSEIKEDDIKSIKVKVCHKNRIYTYEDIEDISWIIDFLNSFEYRDLTAYERIKGEDTPGMAKNRAGFEISLYSDIGCGYDDLVTEIKIVYSKNRFIIADKVFKFADKEFDAFHEFGDIIHGGINKEKDDDTNFSKFEINQADVKCVKVISFNKKQDYILDDSNNIKEIIDYLCSLHYRNLYIGEADCGEGELDYIVEKEGYVISLYSDTQCQELIKEIEVGNNKRIIIDKKVYKLPYNEIGVYDELKDLINEES